MFDSKEVVVYGRSSPSCSYCENLKELLNSKGVVYTYKDITDEETFVEYCTYRLKTVPSVFVDGVYIGGFSEVSELV